MGGGWNRDAHADLRTSRFYHFGVLWFCGLECEFGREPPDSEVIKIVMSMRHAAVCTSRFYSFGVLWFCGVEWEFARSPRFLFSVVGSNTNDRFQT